MLESTKEINSFDENQAKITKFKETYSLFGFKSLFKTQRVRMNTREKIVDVFLQNPDFTQKKISKITGASLSTVKRCIRNYKLNLPLAKKPNGGRPTGPVDKNLEREAFPA